MMGKQSAETLSFSFSLPLYPKRYTLMIKQFYCLIKEKEKLMNHILYQIVDDLAIITLNRPEVANGFHIPMCEEKF